MGCPYFKPRESEDLSEIIVTDNVVHVQLPPQTESLPDTPPLEQVESPPQDIAEDEWSDVENEILP
jgi:hypothetical protein